MKQTMTLTFSRSVVFVFLLLVLLSWTLLAQSQESSSESIFEDFDQDGMTNSEEERYGTDPRNSDSDGDGYTDGVEIESGYDPLIPAPGDRIVRSQRSKVLGVNTSSNDENLTDEIAQKFASVITQVSDEGDNEFDSGEMNEYLDSLVEDKMDFSQMQEIEVSEIDILEQDYDDLSEQQRKEHIRDDVTEYLTAVTYIFVSNSPQDISSPEGIQSFGQTISQEMVYFANSSFSDVSYFLPFVEEADIILQELQSLAVPPQMVDLHKRGLQLAVYSQSLSEEMHIDSNDPAEAIIVLSKAQGLLSLLSDFLIDVEDRLEEMEIEVDELNF